MAKQGGKVGNDLTPQQKLEKDIWGGGRVSEVIKLAPSPSNKNTSKHLATLEQSGWYYDQQLINPLTSVRLYSNKTAQFKDGKWEFEQVANDEYKVLLASSILSEDFNIEISNSWVDNNADDMIGTALNSFKGITPYLGTFHNALKKMSDSQKDKAAAIEDNPNLKGTSLLTKVVNYFGNDEEKGSELLKQIRRTANGSFVAQGCSFTYYGGTGVNFGNLGMKFTMFPTFDAEGHWVSVIKQIGLLLPYCMGILQDVPKELIEAAAGVIDDGVEKIDTKMNSSIGDFLRSVVETVRESNVGKTTKDLLNQYIKWQSPPGGYDIDSPKDLDTNHPGTLCLEIGTHYKIEGLVISNMSLTLSKQLVKYPEYFTNKRIVASTADIGNSKELISPLSCDVNLMLRPVSKYSSTSLLKFIYGNSSAREDTAKNILNSLNNALTLGDNPSLDK